MNIFANISHNYRHKQEIVLLFSEDFCDFQLIRDTIHEFNYTEKEVVYILNTKLLTNDQETFLDSFLRNELGSKYRRCDYRPTERRIQDGHTVFSSYHQNLNVFIFTSDPSENDIRQLNIEAKRMAGLANIIRRPTVEEIETRLKQNRKDTIKEYLKSIGQSLGSLAIITIIVLICIYIDDLSKYLAVAVGICLILGLFLIALSIVTDTDKPIKGWSIVLAILKAILIVGIIIFIIFFIGNFIPDEYHSINDAHRPDRF